ncbi:Molybdenum cofactor guanylyltransferase [hydrothermal vent metagenome]|uniref:Molybdenum cofactor guanylyltransferase n=1 Tax=hydrothermal vent metagenome TaxID=652676 RepID=A0A3B0WA96_9ZZZZ
MNLDCKKISCIILAGGEGKRVDGRDKGLIPYQGKTLIQHVLDSVAPQTDEIVISANRNITIYKSYGYKVISDSSTQYLGPLAGIAASLPHCKNNWALVVACDMPFLPENLVTTLAEGLSENTVCIAESNKQLQLAFLIHKKQLPSLSQSLQSKQLSLMRWVQSQKVSIAKNFKPLHFQNINHSGELIGG